MQITHDKTTKDELDPAILITAADSDHATDSRHRKSVSGIIHRMAGGTIMYKTKYQDIIATSTSEAEFIAACEAGKQILYIRSILDEIGLPQESATVLYEDNHGALLMANAQQPTKRTKHMDTRHFALQDWVERDLILLRRINTTDNHSDAMTKPLPRTLFYRHFDYILGKFVPEYARKINRHFTKEEESTAVQVPITPILKRLAFTTNSVNSSLKRSLSRAYGTKQGRMSYRN